MPFGSSADIPCRLLELTMRSHMHALQPHLAWRAEAAKLVAWPQCARGIHWKNLRQHGWESCSRRVLRIRRHLYGLCIRLHACSEIIGQLLQTPQT